MSDKISLDRLCKALGIPSKGCDLPNDEYIDGSVVWDFVKRREIAKVAAYCKADVVRCREVFKRLTFANLANSLPLLIPNTTQESEPCC